MAITFVFKKIITMNLVINQKNNAVSLVFVHVIKL